MLALDREHRALVASSTTGGMQFCNFAREYDSSPFDRHHIDHERYEDHDFNCYALAHHDHGAYDQNRHVDRDRALHPHRGAAGDAEPDLQAIAPLAGAVVVTSGGTSTMFVVLIGSAAAVAAPISSPSRALEPFLLAPWSEVFFDFAVLAMASRWHCLNEKSPAMSFIFNAHAYVRDIEARFMACLPAGVEKEIPRIREQEQQVLTWQHELAQAEHILFERIREAPLDENDSRVISDALAHVYASRSQVQQMADANEKYVAEIVNQTVEKMQR